MGIEVQAKTEIYAGTTGVEETTFVNSVIEKGLRSQNSVEQQQSYTIDDLQQDLKEKLEEVIADLKNKGIVDDDVNLINLDLHDKKNLEKVIKAFSDISSTDSFLKLSVEEIQAELDKIAKKVKIAFSTKWSLAGITKAQGNDQRGLGERLSLVVSDSDIKDIIKTMGFEALDEEQREKAISALFDDIFNKMQATKKNQEVLDSQIQTFGRILINSSEEEKAYFSEVIEHLFVENMPVGLRETLNSIEKSENREKVSVDLLNKIDEIAKIEDQFGDRISNSGLEELVEIASENVSYDNMMNIHNNNDEKLTKFIEENKEILDKIEAKYKEHNFTDEELDVLTPTYIEALKGKSELTEKESELLAKYDALIADLEPEELEVFKELNQRKAIASGEMIGTANNVVMNESEKKSALIEMNRDNFEHGETFYRNVINMVNEYVETHPEVLHMTQEEFTELMNNVTDGNYSVIINDASTGDRGALTLPGEGVHNSESGQTQIMQGGFGFNLSPEKPTANHSPSELSTLSEAGEYPIYMSNTNSKVASTDTDSYESFEDCLKNCKGNPVKAMLKYCHNNLTKFVKKVFTIKDLGSKASELVDSAVEYFKTLGGDVKRYIVSVASTKYVGKIVKYIPEDQVAGLKGSSIDATKIIRKAQKDAIAP